MMSPAPKMLRAPVYYVDFKSMSVLAVEQTSDYLYTGSEVSNYFFNELEYDTNIMIEAVKSIDRK